MALLRFTGVGEEKGKQADTSVFFGIHRGFLDNVWASSKSKRRRLRLKRLFKPLIE